MIGSGWAGPERESRGRGDDASPRRVAVVTGTRAEYGLLAPVMDAVNADPGLELLVIAAGSHLVQPAVTFREVKRRFPVIADTVPMQIAGRIGRAADVEALGKGIARFGRSFERLRPDWVVVLGDRIEALAAATAASVGGFAVAHLHGGDRAEGVADEAMRHAITKVSHLHLPASEQSAQRIRAMGEPDGLVHVVGSPALDELGRFEPLGDERYAELGSPGAVLLWHPIGEGDEHEEHTASRVLDGLCQGLDAAGMSGRGVLALHPNLDPGRDGIMRAMLSADGRVRVESHLLREQFVGLLKRLVAERGVFAGNSSAGTVEAPAIGVRTIDIGPRQAGRERDPQVARLERVDTGEIASAVARLVRAADPAPSGVHGDGTAGAQTARLLSMTDPHDPSLRRKRFVDR